MFQKFFTLIFLATFGLGIPLAANSELRIVTSTPALADIARNVGGDKVRAESLMRGPENPHHVSPTPSLTMKLRNADAVIHTGLDSEPWIPLLIKSARKENLLAGQPGNIDASLGVAILDVPAKQALTRALGDIHAYGNPHYLLDPSNGAIVAQTIADAFSRLDPENRAHYQAQAKAYVAEIKNLGREIEARLKPYRGTRLVVYHSTFRYFLERFGFVKLAEVEPLPGIEPGPKHLAAVVDTMQREGVTHIIVETFSNHASAEKVASAAHGEVLQLAQEVDALPEAKTYLDLFRINATRLESALQKTAAQKMTSPSEVR